MPKQLATTEKANRGKVRQVMHEFKHGQLHSGSKRGPVVRNRKQAIAIALNQAAKEWVAYKAANYNAHAGEEITGRLYRAGNGQFSSGQGGSDSAPADPRKQVRQNIGNLADKYLNPDVAEALTVGDTPGDLSGIKPSMGDTLVAQGIAQKQPDGSYKLSDAGQKLLEAMANRDEQATLKALADAHALVGSPLAATTMLRKPRRARGAGGAKKPKGTGTRKPKSPKKPKGSGTRKPKGTGKRGRKPKQPATVPAPATNPTPAPAITQHKEAVQLIMSIAQKAKTFGGQTRSKLPDSAFLFPDTRSFPVRSARDVKAAAHAWGRYKGPHSFADFKRKLTARARSLGATSSLPQEWFEGTPSSSSQKEFTGGSFMAYKDHAGNWRWLSVSSSGYRDRDGEIVSTKALADDVAHCDALGEYGPLDWWHTPIELGQCDFNAMHNGLLVESGTFHDPVVAERIATAIKEGRFVPGVSLTFEHNEPGPPVLPGRVFTNIHKTRRALLPAEKASNLAAQFEVSSSPLPVGAKEVNQKMLEQKMKELEALLGPDLVQRFLAGSETAEKALQMAGVAFKAAATLDAPMDKAIGNAMPMPASAPAAMPKKTGKADPMAMMGQDDPTDADPEDDEDDENEEGGGYEGSPSDDQADSIMQDLFDSIGSVVTQRMQEVAAEIKTALANIGGSSEKEASVLGAVATALKENATALTDLTQENQGLKQAIKAFEDRMAALEGNAPQIVRTRASQGQPVPFEQLPERTQALVNKETADKDPYLEMAARMLGGIR